MSVQACTVIALLFDIHILTYKMYKLSYPYSGHDGIWRSGGTVPVILTLTYEYEWSASHQNRCTPSPPHQTEDPPVTPQQLAHRAALTASQLQTACRLSNGCCLVVSIYIYGFWHKYVVGSLLAIVFTALVFYNLCISACKINCPHISPYL